MLSKTELLALVEDILAPHSDLFNWFKKFVSTATEPASKNKVMVIFVFILLLIAIVIFFFVVVVAVYPRAG